MMRLKQSKARQIRAGQQKRGKENEWKNNSYVSDSIRSVLGVLHRDEGVAPGPSSSRLLFKSSQWQAGKIQDQDQDQVEGKDHGQCHGKNGVYG